jgi:hypothetical protein
MREDNEAASLQLLRDIQAELCGALNWLGGKEKRCLLDVLVFHMAMHMNAAAGGYVCLRSLSMLDASKHLIRPIIEPAIRIAVLKAKPDLFYRLAYRERIQTKKFRRATATRKDVNDDAGDEEGWKQFTREYTAGFPDHQLLEKGLPLSDAADAVGLLWLYDIWYRLYSRPIHAALSAVTGADNFADPYDNWIAAFCTASAVEATIPLGAAAPNLSSLRTRLEAWRPVPSGSAQ